MGKRNTLFFGALFGALTGLVVAVLLVRRAESEGRDDVISAGEGLRLGMLLLGMLQQVRRLGEGN
jgi:hypothetical protein